MKTYVFFWRSLLPLLLCALLPAGLALLLYTQAESDARRAWLGQQRILLGQQGRATDEKISELKNLVYGINMDARYQTLIYQQNGATRAHALEIYQVRNDMTQLAAAHNSLKNVYLFCGNSGMVLSNLGKADSPRQFHDLYLQEGMTYPDWMHLLEEVSFDRLLQAGGGIYYAQSLLMQERRNPSATLLFELDYSALLPRSEGASFALISREGELVSADAAFPAVSFGRLTGDEPVQAGESLVFSLDSQQSGWKYLLAVPEAAYQETRAGARGLFARAGLLCLAATCALAALLCLWRMSALRRLWRELGLAGERLDYGGLRRQVLDLRAQCRSLSERLLQRAGDSERFLLLRLLSGWTGSASQARMLGKELGMPEEGVQAVLLLRFEERQSVPGGLAARCEAAGKQLAALCEGGHVWLSPLPGEDAAAALVCLPGGENAQTRLRGCAQKLLSEMASEQRQRVSIACSPIAPVRPEELPRLYARAARAMRGRALAEGKVLLEAGEAPALPSQPAGSLKRLSTLLEARKLTEAKEELRILAAGALSWEDAPERAHIRLMSLTDQVLGLLDAPGAPRAGAESLPSLRRLLEGDHAARTREELEAVLDFCAREPEEGPRQTNVQAVLGYLEEHYADPNLSVAGVAERFGCDPTTLTKSVKQKTGLPVLAYIHQLRIRRAKELLLSPGASIRETAEAVGYVSDITFIRAFKKLESVTPGQYVKRGQSAAGAGKGQVLL